MNSEAKNNNSAIHAIIGAVLVIVVVGISALVTSPDSSPAWTQAQTGQTGQTAPGATGEVTKAKVTIVGMSFSPSSIDVPAGNTLQVEVVNEGKMAHDLVFENGARSALLSPGESDTVDVGVIDKSGEAWCSVAGHRQMGMVLQINVTGSIGASGSDGSQNQDHSMHSDVVPMDDLIAEAALKLPYPAVLEPAPKERVHEYTFEVTEDGELWTFNGTSPGPTLRGHIGDKFVITLVNKGTMGHSIDFHAGEVGPDEPMRTIEPGESLKYEFTANRGGIWMYHCATMPMSTHIVKGMFGAVIIDPDDLEPVDREFVLIQSEGDPDSNPGLMAFNGIPFQYDAHPLQSKTGERVRMWVLNIGPDASLSFHVVGAQFDTAWSEGMYSVYHGKSANDLTKGVTGAQVLPLLAAQGGFVEFVPTEAGHYAFVNHLMTLAERGAHGILEVTD